MDSNAFKMGFAMLCTSFPDRTFDGSMMRVLLDDLTNEQFLGAVYTLCRTKTELFPGTNIAALIREKATARQTTSAEAYSELMTEVSRTGSWGTPKFKDPILEKTVEAMGWRHICMTEEQDLPTFRAQFSRMYDTFKSREYEVRTNESALSVQKLIGLISDRKAINNGSKN